MRWKHEIVDPGVSDIVLAVGSLDDILHDRTQPNLLDPQAGKLESVTSPTFGLSSKSYSHNGWR